MDVYEAGNTIQFTWQSSIQPNSVPVFSFETFSGTLIGSQVAIQSDVLNYFSLMTMPNSDETYYTGTWQTAKTVNAIEYPFVIRTVFKVNKTKVKD